MIGKDHKPMPSNVVHIDTFRQKRGAREGGMPNGTAEAIQEALANFNTKLADFYSQTESSTAPRAGLVEPLVRDIRESIANCADNVEKKRVLMKWLADLERLAPVRGGVETSIGRVEKIVRDEIGFLEEEK